MKNLIVIFSILMFGNLAYSQNLKKEDFNLVTTVKESVDELDDIVARIQKIKEKLNNAVSNEKTEKTEPVYASPKPDGEGWKYDAVNQNWWRYVPNTSSYRGTNRPFFQDCSSSG